MTWLVAVDEAGDLGSCTRFFVMSAIIVRRVRALKPVFKEIPHRTVESKFSNSTESEITRILEKLSSTDVSIISVSEDKYDYNSKNYGVRGNNLYHKMIAELLNRVFDHLGAHDVCLFIDRSTFIGLNDFRFIATDISKTYGANLLRCEKATSHQNKCIQIADYVAGSFFVSLEYGNDKFLQIMKEKNILRP